MPDPVQLPTWDAVVGKRPSRGWMKDAFIFTNLCFFVLVAWSVVKFGSVGSALQSMNKTPGEVLSVNPAVQVEFSEGNAIAEFQLANLSETPVRVVGGQMGCVVTILDEIPFTIDPGSKKSLVFSIQFPKEAVGEARMDILLFTNHPRQREIPLVITGTLDKTRSR